MKIAKVSRLIHIVRGRRVILDKDLAALYGVTTGNLNKGVSRNVERFPSDFMLILTPEEHRILRFQFGILGWGTYSKYPPRAFTQEGVAMLSGVLRSPRAVKVNIEIMRAFVRLRGALAADRNMSTEPGTKSPPHSYTWCGPGRNGHCGRTERGPFGPPESTVRTVIMESR